jgi:transcriptional regulator NrdR family protein
MSEPKIRDAADILVDEAALDSSLRRKRICEICSFGVTTSEGFPVGSLRIVIF